MISRRPRTILAPAAVLALAWCLPAQAQHVTVEEVPTGGPIWLVPRAGFTFDVLPAEDPCEGAAGAGERLDCWHDRLYLRMQATVERLDERLAHEGAEIVPVPLAPFRVGLDLLYLDRPDGPEFGLDLKVDVDLRLPNLERRLRVFFTSEELDESPRQIEDDSDVRAGVRFELPGAIDLDIGARARVWPELFVALKWTPVQRAGNWRFYPFATTYIETDDGLGAAAAFTVDRWWGRFVTRSSSYVNWDDQSDAIGWDQALTFGYATELLEDYRYANLVRGRDFARGIGLTLSSSGEQIHGADSHRIALFYKAPLRGHWLYWSGGPEVRWDREYDWNPDYGFRIGLDALFWGLVAPRR